MSSELLDSVKKQVVAGNHLDEINLSELEKKLNQLGEQKVNIMFVGATGVGKSSTINAIFNTEVAKVGYSVDPETSSVKKYEIDNMILWDTPGLGDSPENDRLYANQITNALKKRDDKGNLLIDVVVVLIDGSNRDMKTAYETIENIIAPFIGDSNRILIGINQCDIAMKGRHWNHEKQQPDDELIAFLNEKVISVKKRIYESTGIVTEPVFYSALHHYNISKLLLMILRNIPEKKRFLAVDSLNKNPTIWKQNDSIEDYNREIQQETRGSLMKALEGAEKGALSGATIGLLVPVIGPAVGAAIGAALGFLGGLFGK